MKKLVARLVAVLAVVTVLLTTSINLAYWLNILQNIVGQFSPGMRMAPAVKACPAMCEVVTLTYVIDDGTITDLVTRIQNVGQVAELYSLEMLIDDRLIGSGSVCIAPGEIETLYFDCSLTRESGQMLRMNGISIPVNHLFMYSFTSPQWMSIKSYLAYAFEHDKPETFINVPPLLPDTHEGSIIQHSYTWFYGGTRWHWEFGIPENLYRYYQSLKRPYTNDYSVYVQSSMDNDCLAGLAAVLSDTALQHGCPARNLPEFLAAFVQGFDYSSDPSSTGSANYPRYPIETLAGLEGDCEDSAILLAKLLKLTGHDVVLVGYPNHYGVAVAGIQDAWGGYWEYDGRDYFYLETTITGWKPGEIPERLKAVPAMIYPVTLS
ncbi:MAG: hypothetical protein JW954_02710 [Dehalococcoidaceae bacterium]|nr:hypothetical protein [Dehalococcoidaceae bacterium]